MMAWLVDCSPSAFLITSFLSSEVFLWKRILKRQSLNPISQLFFKQINFPVVEIYTKVTLIEYNGRWILTTKLTNLFMWKKPNRALNLNIWIFQIHAPAARVFEGEIFSFQTIELLPNHLNEHKPVLPRNATTVEISICCSELIILVSKGIK